MYIIFVSVHWQLAIVYIDNINCFYNFPQDHLKKLGNVLQLLSKNGAIIKFKKWTFFSATILSCGQNIWTAVLTLQNAPQTLLRRSNTVLHSLNFVLSLVFETCLGVLYRISPTKLPSRLTKWCERTDKTILGLEEVESWLYPRPG